MKRHILGIVALSASLLYLPPHSASAEETQPARANLLKAPVALAAEDRSDLQYLRDHTKLDTPYVLDLANPAVYRHVVRMLNLAGETDQHSPQLHARLKALSSARKLTAGDLQAGAAAPKIAVTAEQQYQPINAITNLANSGGTNYTASTISSIYGGTQRTTTITTLYGFDQNNNPVVYATNSGTTNTQGTYFPSGVAGQNPEPGPTTEVEAMFAYVPPGGPPDPVVVYVRGQDTINPSSTCMQLPQYCVRDNNGNCTGAYQTACTNTVANTTPIKICWNRGSQQECDYWNQGAHPQNYFFPLQGTATFSTPITNPPAGIATIYLVNPTQGGGCYMVFQQAQPLGTGWSLSNNNQTLTFSFPTNTFANNGCVGQSGGTFNTNLLVQVDGLVLQNAQYGSFRFSSDRSLIGQPGVSTIPGMQLQDGCFAAGTLIGMGDGGDKLIESVAIGDEVRTGDGQRRIVSDIVTGWEPKPMVRISTADKRTLLVTETHPLATADGPIMAKEVKMGQEIRTESGVTTVAGLATELYSGKVYNLRIGTEADAEAGKTMLVANGLAAGDVAAQQLIEKQSLPMQLTDATATLDQINPDWQIDFKLHHPERF